MKKGRIFGYVMLVVAVILLAVVISNEIGAVRETGDTYSILRNYEISAEESVVIGYDDGFAAVLFYGTNDTLLTMEQFLKDSLRNIDIRKRGE